MRITAPASPRQLDIAQTVLRVVAGSVFAMHGWQKLFVFGFAGVSGAFAQMGVPLPGIAGPAIALLEFFGGLALIAGVLTRPLALALAADMLGAILLVHLPNGFFAPKGVEFVLMLFGSALAIAITGAGRWSLDARLGGVQTSGTSEIVGQRRAA